MQSKIRKLLATLLTLILIFGTLTALPLAANAAADTAESSGVFEVEGFEFFTDDLNDVLELIGKGYGPKVTLHDDHTHYGFVYIYGEHGIIEFDLNGYTLNIDGGNEIGLYVEDGGGLIMTDPGNGELNIIGASGLKTNFVNVEVTNVTATSPDGFGVDASDDGTVIVHGSITSAGDYIIIDKIPFIKSDGVPSIIKPGYLEYAGWDVIVLVKGSVCELTDTGVQYVSVADAINAVPGGGSATIKLLQDIEHIGRVTVDNKIITFELNGKTLDIINDSDPVITSALYVLNNGEVNINGEGELNVAGYSEGVWADSGGKVTVTNACCNQRHVLETVAAVFANGAGSQVIVTGDITGGEYGAAAALGAQVIVNGNVMADRVGAGIVAGGQITVKGNITVDVPSGDRTGKGAEAYGADSKVNVIGDITVSAADAWITDIRGVRAAQGGEVVVDGKITVPEEYGIYITIENTFREKEHGVISARKPGYLEYTDSASTAWVKIEKVIPEGVLVQVSDATGRAGEEVTLDVTMEGNPGIASFSLTMKYPLDKLEYLETAPGDIIFDNFYDYEISAGQINVSATSFDGADVSSGETLFTITFKLKEGVGDGIIGDSEGLSLGLYGPIDGIEHDRAFIDCVFEQGAITVRNVRYGDVNGDGIINLLDVTRLLQFLRAIDTSNNGFIAANADANGDGFINMLDVTAILRFIRGIDPGPLGPNTAPIAPAMQPLSFAPFAAIPINIGTGTTVSVSDASGKAGDEISLTVSLEDNPGIASYSLTMLYPDELEFISSQAGDIISDNYYCYSPADGQINVSATSFDGADVAAGTTLFTLTFRIKDDAAAGVLDGIELGLHLGNDLIESEAKRLPIEFSQGLVTVEADEEEPTLVSAKTKPADFVSINETSKNSKVWALKFNVTETWSDGETKVELYTIELSGNNANLDGSYTFKADHVLAGYSLVYDIKGNGSNIKDFKLIN